MKIFKRFLLLFVALGASLSVQGIVIENKTSQLFIAVGMTKDPAVAGGYVTNCNVAVPANASVTVANERVVLWTAVPAVAGRTQVAFGAVNYSKGAVLSGGSMNQLNIDGTTMVTISLFNNQLVVTWPQVSVAAEAARVATNQAAALK